MDFSNSDGTTALLIAAQGAGNEKRMSEEKVEIYISIVRLLLDAGASINKIDNGGDSVLSNSVRVNGIDMCRLLVGKGAEVNPQMSYSNAICPLELAREKEFEAIASFLEGAGASTDRATSNKRPAKVGSLAASEGASGESEDKTININEAKLTDKLPCSGCGKTFTVKTLRKWGEQCHNCYSKSDSGSRKKANTARPKKKASPAKQPISREKQSSSIWASIGSFFEGLFEFIEGLFEVLKALAILGVGIAILVAIIAALFSG